MTRTELEALADRWQSKADRAFETYQETGARRYYTERNNAEDLADALRMAANSADEHNKYIHMRGTLSSFVALAKEVMAETPVAVGPKQEKLLEGLVSYGRMNGVG